MTQGNSLRSATVASCAPVDMLNLNAEFAIVGNPVRAAIDDILTKGQFIGGPAVQRFEELMKQRLGVAHAVAISSGTDAILCALMALEIGPGDEVVVPTFTFFATAGCVVRVGAKPVFADVDRRTFNLDPASLERAITPQTKAVIPVHLYGQCADMNRIMAISRERNLAVIEDAAQAVGAVDDGRIAGGFGNLACLSFYPTKNLGGFGEGGMILSNDSELSATVRQLRTHGESTRYHHDRVGGNFRLDALKAAILTAKLDFLDEFNRRRAAVARAYSTEWKNLPIATPFVPAAHHPVWHQYTIQTDRRDELQSFLRDHGVASMIYYPVPLHRQKCFTPYVDQNLSFPIADELCRTVLSLPCHPMMTDGDVDRVVESVRRFFPLMQRGESKSPAKV